MGRIKTALIKRIGTKLHDLHEDVFTENFAENKLKVAERADIHSKKMKNVITGYVTRLAKNKKRDQLWNPNHLFSPIEVFNQKQLIKEV